jgi:probable F420-dependent oxidoreductase
MKLNYQFPTRAVKHWERWVGERDLADVAMTAEECGLDMVSTTDHPFPSREWLEGGGHHSFDPFVSLAFMAARTTRLRLLTFVLVSGYRNPYLTAKSAASLDLLSHGRLVMGTGAGYQKAEFDALGGSFPDRGKRYDAALGAMREAWSGEVVVRPDGYFPASGNMALPRPAQRPGPPIWVGGNGAAAMRRVAEHADGWLPFEQPREMAAVTGTPALTGDQLAERITRIREMRIAADRPAEFDVCFTPRLGRDPARNADILATAIPGLAEAGVTHVSLGSHAGGIAECLDEIALYGRALAPGREPALEPNPSGDVIGRPS